MRKLIVNCLLLIVNCFVVISLIKLIGIQTVFGATISPTSSKLSPTTTANTNNSTPSPSLSSDLIEKLKQIELLKEKIATRVTQLRENEKVALHGTLSARTSGSITLATSKGVDHKITYLDDTVFYSITGNKKSTIKSDKLASESAIAVFGYYNEDHSVITAKYVYDISDSPLSIIGKVSEVNKDDFTVSVTDGKETRVFDYEKTTRTFTLAPSKTSWVRSGFSKLTIGDTLRISGTVDDKEKDRWDAQNIYIVVSSLVTPTAQPTKSATPSAKPTS